MDSITYYKYAYGGIDDVLNGKFEALTVAKSQSELPIQPSSQKVIVPKLIGVYQEWDLKPDNKEESELLSRAKVGRKLLEHSLITSADGISDNFHPNLIHIGYDPNLLDERLIREFMRSERIKVSPYGSMPDFYTKEDEVQNYCKKLVELIGDKEKLKQISRKVSDKLKIQLSKFGFTKIEYQFLIAVEKFKNLGQEQKLVTDSGLVNLISRILSDEEHDEE